MEYDDNGGYDSGDGDVPLNIQKNNEESSLNLKEADLVYNKKDPLTTTATTNSPTIRKPSDQSTNNNGRDVESKRNASSSAKTNCEDKYHLESECAQNKAASAKIIKNSEFFAAINDSHKSGNEQGASPECSDSICSDKEDQKVGCLFLLIFRKYMYIKSMRITKIL